MRQVRTGKANVSEPLLTCRKRIDDIKTRVQLLPWEKSGGCLSIGQAVSGMKVARARFRLQCGTRERLAPMPLAGCWTGWREGEAQAAETVRARVPTGPRLDRVWGVRGSSWKAEERQRAGRITTDVAQPGSDPGLSSLP